MTIEASKVNSARQSLYFLVFFVVDWHSKTRSIPSFPNRIDYVRLKTRWPKSVWFSFGITMKIRCSQHSLNPLTFDSFLELVKPMQTKSMFNYTFYIFIVTNAGKNNFRCFRVGSTQKIETEYPVLFSSFLFKSLMCWFSVQVVNLNHWSPITQSSILILFQLLRFLGKFDHFFSKNKNWRSQFGARHLFWIELASHLALKWKNTS